MWTYSTKRFRTTISSRTSDTQRRNRAWAFVIVISSEPSALLIRHSFEPSGKSATSDKMWSDSEGLALVSWRLGVCRTLVRRAKRPAAGAATLRFALGGRGNNGNARRSFAFA